MAALWSSCKCSAGKLRRRKWLGPFLTFCTLSGIATAADAALVALLLSAADGVVF